MQPRKIQLKHPHGPISIIIEYLPDVEQLKMQALNSDFYKKVIPGILRKILISRTFLFATYTESNGNDDRYQI